MTAAGPERGLSYDKHISYPVRKVAVQVTLLLRSDYRKTQNTVLIISSSMYFELRISVYESVTTGFRLMTEQQPCVACCPISPAPTPRLVPSFAWGAGSEDMHHPGGVRRDPRAAR